MTSSLSFFALYLVIGCCNLRSITSAAAPYRQQNSLYHEEMCYDNETGRAFYIGEAEYRQGKCERVQCLGDLQIAEYKCKIPRLEGNCTTIASPNPNGHYPDCCPLYECQILRYDDRETVELKTYNHFGSLQRSQIRQVFLLRVNPNDINRQLDYAKFHIPYNAQRN